MTKRIAMRLLPVLIVFVLLSTGVTADPPQRPNILLIMADDMGYSDLGCYGSEIKTPNIDKLASGGLRFTQFYNTGICCPSRASLMTGLYSHQAGVGHMTRPGKQPGYLGYLSNRCTTIPEVLKSVGYRTMMTGKWHLGWQDEVSPTGRGFDRFYGTRGYIDSYFTVIRRTEVYLDDKMVIPATEKPENHLFPEKTWYTTDVFTDYAIKFMDEALDEDMPFFAYVAYNAPHFPLHAHTDDIAKYRGKYQRGWNTLRRERFERMQKMGLIDMKWDLSNQDSTDWSTLTEEQKNEADFRMAVYAAIVDRLDQNVGRLVAFLKERDQLDNTLILFLSDNGGSSESGMFGLNADTAKAANYPQWQKAGGWTSSYGQGWANVSNTPFRMFKRYSHEGGTAAPLIVHWPARLKDVGALRHQQAHIIDILPTFAELSGAEYPTKRGSNDIIPLEGKSLVPAFDNKPVAREAIYWEHEGNRAVRVGDWKLVAVNKGQWELFNMAVDRTETTDLSTKYPDKVQQFSTMWDTWAQRAQVFPRPVKKR